MYFTVTNTKIVRKLSFSLKFSKSKSKNAEKQHFWHFSRAQKPLSLFPDESNIPRNIYKSVEVHLNSSTPLSNDVNTAIIYQYIAIRVTSIGIV